MSKKQETRQARINALMIYLPHLTLEQATKHIDIEIELEQSMKVATIAKRRALGWR